jgi:hypothetical protein
VNGSNGEKEIGRIISPMHDRSKRGDGMSTNLAINDFDFLMPHSLMAFVEYTFAERANVSPAGSTIPLLTLCAPLKLGVFESKNLSEQRNERPWLYSRWQFSKGDGSLP